MVDPIADMFTRIRNGHAVHKESVLVPYSKFKLEIAKLLQTKGYIKELAKRRKKGKKNLEITLLYKEDQPAIKKIKRISKSSRRVYMPSKEIFSVGRGYGARIMSTPKGVMIDKDARKQGVGGEVIAEIW